MSSPENLRVAIIGAGPSGLTLAYYLKALGMKSVHFFEAQDQVGGQSVTNDVGGHPVEMGTVYLTDGYVLARKIAKSVDCPAEVLPAASVLNDQGKIIKVARPPVRLLIRYLFLWMLWYFTGQMRAPTRPYNALSFADWLRRKGLGDLAEGFAFSAGLTAQLYGPIEDISAHSGLNWMRPSLFRTAKHETVASIPAGFQNMWKRLSKDLGYTVSFNQRIDSVEPIRGSDGHQVKLLGHDGESDKPIDETFDHVFIACPLDFMEDHPLVDTMKKSEGSPLNQLEHPLSEALRTRYSPFAATEVYSGAWTAKQKSWPKRALSRCYLPAATRNEVGPLLTIRNYGTAENAGVQAVGQFCSYAFPDHPPESGQQQIEHNQQRLERNRKQVVKDMRDIVGLEDVKIVHERLWRYNNRFSQEQLAEGLPLFIEASQGKQNVWYSGGTMSHWNIDAITDYSLVLAKLFAKQIGMPLRTRLKIFSLADIIADF